MAKKLPSIEVEIDGIEYKSDLNEDLRIDKFNLEDEFVEHSEKAAYYSTLHELAQSKLDHLKNKLELLYSKLDFELRQVVSQAVDAEGKTKKYTERMYETEVKLNKEYQILKKEVLEFEYKVRLIKVAADAFCFQRKEMLKELGANSRYGSEDLALKGKHLFRTED